MVPPEPVPPAPPLAGEVDEVPPVAEELPPAPPVEVPPDPADELPPCELVVLPPEPPALAPPEPVCGVDEVEQDIETTVKARTVMARIDCFMGSSECVFFNCGPVRTEPYCGGSA
jgi:hypothetical protein